MKTKKSKRVMAVVMAVLLTVGIMPMDWAVTKAAASTVHSFDATAQASVGDDKAVIAEGTTFNDGYFKIVGKVTQRPNSDGTIKAYELASKAAGDVQFTTESTSSVVVGLSSTGGSNESAVALINTADNSVVAEDAGTAVVAGTKKTELKYTALPAGTYLLKMQNVTVAQDSYTLLLIKNKLQQLQQLMHSQLQTFHRQLTA